MAAVVQKETHLSQQVLASAVGVAMLETYVFSSFVAANKMHRANSSRFNAPRVCITWVKCFGTHQDGNIGWWKNMLDPTVYLYDGADLIEELDGNGSISARYAHGRQVDEPLAEVRAGASSYYDSDGIISTTSLISSTGLLASSYTYDSYGTLTATTGTMANPFRFTDREFDQETGLYNYRSRYYDPSIGRFLSEDTVQFWGGINFYTYVLGNPVNYRDPSGNMPVWGWWCGPNWTGGHREQYDPSRDKNGYYHKPYDGVDSVCKEHDICYYRCRRDFPCDQHSRQTCMRGTCDMDLLQNIPHTKPGLVVGLGILWGNSSPDAGDNAKNCPCNQK
jgi:RHS repeat-associated protein